MSTRTTRAGTKPQAVGTRSTTTVKVETMSPRKAKPAAAPTHSPKKAPGSPRRVLVRKALPTVDSAKPTDSKTAAVSETEPDGAAVKSVRSRSPTKTTVTSDQQPSTSKKREKSSDSDSLDLIELCSPVREKTPPALPRSRSNSPRKGRKSESPEKSPPKSSKPSVVNVDVDAPLSTINMSDIQEIKPAASISSSSKALAIPKIKPNKRTKKQTESVVVVHQKSNPKAEELKLKEGEEVKLGATVVAKMPSNDMNTFLERLSEQCPPYETRSSDARCNIINWSSVAFSPYSEEECRAAWRYLRNGTRRFRIMAELVQEVKLAMSSQYSPFTSFKSKCLESLPGFPANQRNVSGFSAFIVHKWKTRTEAEKKKYPGFLPFQTEFKKSFYEMSKEEQEKWAKRSDDARNNFEQEVEEYFDSNPDLSDARSLFEEIRVSTRTRKNKKSPGSSMYSRIVGGAVKKAARRVRRPSNTSVGEAFPDAPQLPMNPQALFINSRIQKLDADDVEQNLTAYKLKYSQKWSRLSDRKKAKWIDKCINKCEEYRQEVEAFQAQHPSYKPPAFKLIQKVSKPEISIWETYKERPIRPPFTVTELLQSKLLKRQKYQNLTPTQLKELSDKKLSEMSQGDRELYQVHFKQLVTLYRIQIAEFYRSIPEVVRPSVYATIPKKFRTGLLESDRATPPPPRKYSKANDVNVKTELSAIPELRKKIPKPKSAEYILECSSSDEEQRNEQASSSNNQNQKKSKPNSSTSIYEDIAGTFVQLPLPKMEADSPERKPYSEFYNESESTEVNEEDPLGSPPPPKKKKKKKHQDDHELEVKEEYVVGLPSSLNVNHTSTGQPTTDELDELTTEEIPRKKAKKKKNKEKRREEAEEEDYEEEVKYVGGYNNYDGGEEVNDEIMEVEHPSGFSSSFPGDWSSSSESDSEESTEEDDPHHGKSTALAPRPPPELELSEKEKKKIQEKLSKEYRDKAVARYEKQLRRDMKNMR